MNNSKNRLCLSLFIGMSILYVVNAFGLERVNETAASNKGPSAVVAKKVASSPERVVVPESILPELRANKVDEFSWNLLRETFRESPNSNGSFSPYGLQMSLLMLYAGAKGETATQIAKVLGGDSSYSREEFLFALRGENTNTVSSKNGVWAQKGQQINETYRKFLVNRQKAAFGGLDFKKDAANSYGVINKWFKDNSNGRLNDVLRNPDPETKLILANLVYFNEEWVFPFSSSDTNIQAFKQNGNEEILVRMMNMTEQVRYAEFRDLKAVMLPYRNKSALLAIVPQGEYTLEHVINKLNDGTVHQIFRQMKPEKVDITLLKFKVNSRIDLNPVLKGMGITSVFSPSADLSGISQDKELRLSQCIQQTMVDVKETGTEAASGTGMDICLAGLVEKENNKIFITDRPFVYFIIDKANGAVLFMGYIVKPDSAVQERSVKVSDKKKGFDNE